MESLSSPTTSLMKAYVFRLEPGSDLYISLKEYLKTNNIRAACILTCVGSLRKIHLRTATGASYLKKEDFFEITSLVGCVSTQRNHIHITLADSEGKTIGGHLIEEGNIVYTTAEIVLGVFDQLEFQTFQCEKSGWPELKIIQK